MRPPWCGFGGVVYGDQRFPRAGLLPQLSPAAVPCASGLPVHLHLYSFVRLFDNYSQSTSCGEGQWSRAGGTVASGGNP